MVLDEIARSWMTQPRVSRARSEFLGEERDPFGTNDKPIGLQKMLYLEVSTPPSLQGICRSGFLKPSRPSLAERAAMVHVEFR
jgi:hypothetical protein